MPKKAYHWLNIGDVSSAAPRPRPRANAIRTLKQFPVSDRGHHHTQYYRDGSVELPDDTANEWAVQLEIAELTRLATRALAIGRAKEILESLHATAAALLHRQGGFVQLTDMLLCEGPGTNRYLTREDFDVSLVEAAGTGSMDSVKLLVERVRVMALGAD